MSQHRRVLDTIIVVCQWNSKDMTADEAMQIIAKTWEYQTRPIWAIYRKSKKSKVELMKFMKLIGFVR